MHRIFVFLRRYRYWLVFFLLEGIALSFLFSSTLYQKSVSWYATSVVFGHINEVMTEVRDYIDLRPENTKLLEENARLRQANVHLARQMQDALARGELPRLHATDSLPVREGTFVIARVVNRTSHSGEVFYTIDKGEADGIHRDMGVMSGSGVVGAVMATSRHYALVIPVLNSKIRLSCTLLGQQVSGTLTASTNPNSNEAILSNVPPHARPHQGDTVITSGYSYLFPEGMMIGTIADSVPTTMKGSAGTFANYPVRLATDFQSLRFVYVILEKPVAEAKALEDSIQPNE